VRTTIFRATSTTQDIRMARELSRFDRYLAMRLLGAGAFFAGLGCIAADIQGWGFLLVLLGGSTCGVGWYLGGVRAEAVARLRAASPALHSNDAPPLPDRPAEVLAERERVSSVAGVGCLIQAVGLLALFVLPYLFDGPGFIAGVGVAIVLFLLGSSKSFSWRCGNCRNPVASKHVRICPVCKARLTS
jgi:hypothetical protein